MKNKLFYLVLILCSLLMACQTEGLYNLQAADSQSITLTFTELGKVVTRSATTPQSEEESTIHECYIVVFSDPSTVRFFQKVQPEDIKDDAGGDYRKKRIILPLSSFESIVEGDRIFVILNPTADKYNETGLTQSNILERFVMDDKNSGYAFVGSGLPMYGSAVKGSGAIAVDIRSSVAKIQLRFAETINGADTYKFTNPDLLRYAVAQHVQTGYMDGSSPSVTTTDPVRDYTTSIDKSMPGAIAHDAGNYTGAIYLYPFPSSVRAVSTKPSHTVLKDTQFDYRRACLLLHNTDPGVPADQGRYYRIDLIKNGKYIDIRSATHYVVNIVSVKNWGYRTATEALMHPSSNIEFELVSLGDQLFSNGQYGLSIRENQIKTNISMIHNPLLESDINGNLLPDGAATQVEMLHLTTIHRQVSPNAPVDASTSLDITFTSQKIGTLATNIKVDFIKVEGGIEEVITSPFSGTLGDSPFELKVRFSGTGQMQYAYTVKLGNIEYASTTFNYTSGYMYNTNERQHIFHLGRDMPSDIRWSGGSSTPGPDPGTHYITFPEDNSRPLFWRVRREDGSFNNDALHSDSASVPVFRDKELLGVGVDTKIRIIQARPFYFGKFRNGALSTDVSGEHLIATAFNLYDQIFGNMRIGTTYSSITQARDAATNWAGKDLSESVGWRLPLVYNYDLCEGLAMYKSIFHSASSRGGDVSTIYHHLNDWIDWTGTNENRYNFLPLGTTPIYGVYWALYQHDSDVPSYLLVDTKTAYYYPNSNFKDTYVRPVRAVPVD